MNEIPGTNGLATQTATLTLSDFLLARIAEDEELWTLALDADMAFTARDAIPAVPPKGFAKRMLAECEAKRAIVEFMRPVAEDECEYSGWVALAEAPLRAMAAVYAEHEDYRDEYHPDYEMP